MERQPRGRWGEEDEHTDLALPLPRRGDADSPEDGYDSPRDDPLAVFDFGTTGWEERRAEPLDLSLGREEPDDGPAYDEAPEQGEEFPLPAFAEDDGWTDSSSQDPFAGRLVAADEGAHDTVVAEEVAWVAGDDTGGYSAEEAAMHVVSDLEI